MRDEIDRVLSGAGDMIPSSGFSAAVMEAVRREAATPPPLPFPWKRALPGLMAGGGATLSAPAADGSIALVAFVSAAGSPEATWILAASLLALATVKVGLRFAEG